MRSTPHRLIPTMEKLKRKPCLMTSWPSPLLLLSFSCSISVILLFLLNGAHGFPATIPSISTGPLTVPLPRSLLSTDTDLSSPPVKSIPYLKMLYVSHGTISFVPEQTDYSIPLSSHFETLEIVPILYSDRGNGSGRDHPLIHVGIGTGSKQKVIPGIGASLDIRGFSEGAFDVIVEVVDKSAPGGEIFVQYKLMFDGSDGVPATYLKELEVQDQDGNVLEVNPAVHKDALDFSVFSLPQSRTWSVTGLCQDGCEFLVDGKAAPVHIVKDSGRSSQLIQVECRKEFKGQQYSRNYFLLVTTQLDSILPPSSLVVETSGNVCKVSADSGTPIFECEANTSTASFIATVPGQYKYTIVNADSSLEVRLLNNEPSAKVPLNSGLMIRATAGHVTKKWPLLINGMFFPSGGNSFMQALGWIIGVLLLLSVATLLFVLCISNVFGMGSPFGASEVPSTLILLLQYFCFSTAMRGAPTLAGDMTTFLKYVTLWWPLPWDSDGEVSVYLVDNAAGCLFWCGVIVTGCLGFHLLAWLKFRLLEPASTYPHRMLLGHWESRLLHFMAFPACTACFMLLFHPVSSVGGRLLGGFVATAIAGWASLSYSLVKRVVKSRSVVWVWNQSLRDHEASELEDGYWCDATCDQLQTEPANRSICRYLFPWRWSSTVADIQPVSIAPSGLYSAAKTAASMGSTLVDDDDEACSVTDEPPVPLVESYRRQWQAQNPSVSSSQDSPMGKSPQNVEVTKTRAPNRTCCAGQMLVAGLFRTQWIDILFTYDSLTKYKGYEERHGVETETPLTVKTNQLTGPLSGGHLCFFFDGVRMPFIRPGEFLFRALLGGMLGVVLGVGTWWVSGVCFLLVAAVASLSCVYVTIVGPYSRRIENWLLGSMLGTVALSAVGFMIVSLAGRVAVVLDIISWVMCLTFFSLSVYSAFITGCILSAIMCPPMEEFRFLERLCNTSVVLSDHSEGFATQAMGYNRFGTRDIMIQCSVDRSTKGLDIKTFPVTEEPTIELPITDVIAASRSGQLATARVCVFITSDNALGYKHLILYDRLNLYSRLSSFLASERTAAPHMARLTDVILRQIETRSQDSAVLALTIVLPKSTPKACEWAQSRGAHSTMTRGAEEGDGTAEDSAACASSLVGYTMQSSSTEGGRSSRRGYSKLTPSGGLEGTSARGGVASRPSSYSLSVEMREQRGM
eukprot:GHVQ01004524.1.p1 GENE.GHVQ01004524.1~~GHVQ01004524.1.p1  ORF type:complete len:1190 (-),score=135.20 GHVQ01004524.1:768-4337(-)